jgi:hypothetical protein
VKGAGTFFLFHHGLLNFNIYDKVVWGVKGAGTFFLFQDQLDREDLGLSVEIKAA